MEHPTGGQPSPQPDAAGADRWLWSHFRHHSRSFSFATRLLPRRVRLPVAVVYFYCRTVDNIADELPDEIGHAAAVERLDRTAEALEATLRGTPPAGLLWERLGQVTRSWTLQPDPFRELIEGARWDLERRPVRDFDDLVHYSELVAGSIGAMVLPMLAPDPVAARPLVAPARALGVAMQITNILRDVGEDRRELQRSYLPDAWLREHGQPTDRAPEPHDPRYRSLVERLMAEAETRFTTGLAGVTGLPVATRTGIRAAARVYREILNEVRTNGYDNVTRRAVVPLRRKVLLTVVDGYEARRSRLRRMHGTGTSA